MLARQCQVSFFDTPLIKDTKNNLFLSVVYLRVLRGEILFPLNDKVTMWR